MSNHSNSRLIAQDLRPEFVGFASWDDVGKTGRHRNINNGVDLHFESGVSFGREVSTLSVGEILEPSITYSRIMPWHELTSRHRGEFLQTALVNDGLSQVEFSSDIKRTYSSPVSNHSIDLPNSRLIASRTSAPISPSPCSIIDK